MKKILNFLLPFLIIGGSVIIGARIIVAGKPDVVLYVTIAGPATATEPATRVPLRLWGAGDSSFEWGLGAAMITLDAADPAIVYDSDLERTDRNSYAELGCPLVEDGMLMRHADNGDTWVGIGNDVHPCDWRKPTTEQDVVIASWGPTAMYDRRLEDGPTVSLFTPSFSQRTLERMAEFEAFAGVPVLWVNWVDEPSPTDREDLWSMIVFGRACSVDIRSLELDFEPDGIHLSPQGSLTAGAALIAAAKQCAR